jgi:ligand-binding sensor domain-containing protein/signal transduction histidine kinase
MQKKAIKTFVTVLYLAVLINAQQANLKFERVTTEKGPSTGTINSILKDKLGFIWICTNAGLIRYDGYNFKEYKHSPVDSNSISGNQIWSIIQDRLGDLWIGTSGRGLNKYLYKEDRFVHYYHNRDDSTSLNSDLEVPWLFEDSGGLIWVALWEGGFDQYDRATNSFVHYKHNRDNPNSLISNSAHRIFEDKNGFLWIGTSRGLSKFDRAKKQFVSYKHNPNDQFSIAGDYIYSIIQDKSGNLWIGTYGGLSRYDYKKDKFYNYLAKNSDPFSISNNAVNSLCEDPFGNIWVGTDGGGLNYLNVKSGIFTRYFSENESDNFLTASSIPFLYVDDNSILWIGTVAAGLYKVVYNKNKFSQLTKGLSDKNNLSYTEVSTILEEEDDENVWIGTYGSGLYKQNIKSKKITHYKSTKNLNSLSNDFILSFAKDADRLWIGTENGLNLFEPNINKFTRYLYDSDDTTSISGNKVPSLLKDSKGNLWIGTDGGGLNMFIPDNKTFQRLSLSKQKPVFPSSHVWSFFEDSKGNIWIGTWGLGVIKYDYNTNAFTQYNTKSINKDSIILNVVISISEDKFSNIWLGTWGNGLYKLNPESNEITGYGILNGIPHENIYGIIPDDSGNLWISTGNGLTKFNPSTNKCQTYDEEDGLQSLEFRRGAFYKGKSGKFYFGGVKGLNYFYPYNITDNQNDPNVVFTSFRLFDRTPSATRIGHDINMLDQINLSYNENYISFEFSALEYTSPRKNRYAYMLEGVDKDWNYSESRRYASYPDLNPSEYIFRVKAANSDGVWNHEGRSIKLIITPPIWLRWYAYVLYTLIFLGALYSFRRFELNKRKLKEEARIRMQKEEAELREARLKAESAELKTIAMESEKEIEKQQMRNRIAADLHDEIGSNLSSISLLSTLTKKKITDGGEVLKNLNEIILAAKTSSESMREIIWLINPMSDQLQNLISKMKETANVMLGNINHEVIAEICASEEKINPEIKRNIYLIYKETLNNIMKHSNAKKARILIKKVDSDFILSVSDDGVGFDDKNIKDGNGLKNLNTRAEQINAELTINSILTKGTEVTLKIKI